MINRFKSYPFFIYLILLILVIFFAALFSRNYFNNARLSPSLNCTDCLTESLCSDASYKLYLDNSLQPGLCQQLRSQCGYQCTGLGPGFGGASKEECARLKSNYDLQVSWYNRKCLASGCGYPIPSCCQSGVGSCCLLARNGTALCLSNLTSEQCLYERFSNPTMVDYNFVDGAQCSEANCSQGFSSAQGTCCTLNETGGINCADPASYSGCFASPGVKHAWVYNQTCSSVSCEQILNETLGTCCVTDICSKTSGISANVAANSPRTAIPARNTICTENIARSSCYGRQDSCHTIEWRAARSQSP